MFKTIQLYPEDFKSLLEAIGFEFVEEVAPQEIKKGFGRVIDIYRKKRPLSLGAIVDTNK